ncbi:cell division protein FtsL [Paenibacillus harenae]|uniref:Cell division protein FtsL n=1 Tax=Paenibacillus harenae TaxID=306543 RepID=A0ABT9TZQ1_PAEHA|nr:cell division protein FtsL [Paenibacillus harenae]MDQ0059396.1 cell division protein FtsL [Paenibacillus harenae]MDQ0112862.1 cell division protein FtsL [Paenibacillus harenae]
MAYVNGNLALQPKRKPEKQQAIRDTKRVVVKKKTIPMQEKLLYLFTILMCVVVAFVIISRYAQIYDMNLQIKQLNNEYQTMNVEMEELKKQVEMLNDPERIRKMAETQGMVSITDSGITVKTGVNGDGVQSAMRE